MREFLHFSYHTEYSCHGSISKNIEVTPCFAFAFRNLYDNADVYYKVQFFKGPDFQKRMGHGSACIATKEQINYILNSLNRIHHFFFKIEEYQQDGWDKYRVVLHIKGVPAMFHKFVLANLRCVYEFPHNLLLCDAFRLKERSPFKKENIFNLLNLTLGCSYDNLHGEHLPIKDEKAIYRSETIMSLKSRIRRIDKLHKVYRQVDYSKFRIPFQISADEESNYTVRDIEYWNMGFSERLPVYEKAYLLKKTAERKQKRS